MPWLFLNIYVAEGVVTICALQGNDQSLIGIEKFQMFFSLNDERIAYFALFILLNMKLHYDRESCLAQKKFLIF